MNILNIFKIYFLHRTTGKKATVLRFSQHLWSTLTLADCKSSKIWPPVELPTANAAHISITPPFFEFFGILRHILTCFVTSSVGTQGNDPRSTHMGKVYLFVTFGQNLRSTGRHIRPWSPLIYERGQKILLWCQFFHLEQKEAIQGNV